MSREMKAKKPITEIKIRTEIRLVQIRKQVCYCASCNAEIPLSIVSKPDFCLRCGCAIDWRNFMAFPSDVVKLIPLPQEDETANNGDDI